MKKYIKHTFLLFLLTLALLVLTGIISKPKDNNMIMPADIIPKEKYSHTEMMEIGGLYQFELYSNNTLIKECDLKVNKDTVEFISESNTESIPLLVFNYNTIALLSENDESSMILHIESNGEGYIRADLIGVVAKDIIGEYKLINKSKNNLEELIAWDITGEITSQETNENDATANDIRIMCLSEDNNKNVYLEIFNGSEWESYSFYIIGNTIFLEQVFG